LAVSRIEDFHRAAPAVLLCEVGGPYFPGLEFGEICVLVLQLIESLIEKLTDDAGVKPVNAAGSPFRRRRANEVLNTVNEEQRENLDTGSLT
jgi:hypothetical protein